MVGGGGLWWVVVARMGVGGGRWWWVVVGWWRVVMGGDYDRRVAYHGCLRETSVRPAGDHGSPQRPVPAHRFWPGIWNLVLYRTPEATLV